MKRLKLIIIVTMLIFSFNYSSARVIEASTDMLIEHYQNTSRIMVIDCYATWCGPCQQYAPVFDSVSNMGFNADFFRLDVDEYPDCFNLRSIPCTVIIYTDSDGEMQALFEPGYMQKSQLIDYINRGIRLNY